MARLDAFNLFDDSVRECPFAYLQTIRQESPVYFMKELGSFYVSRYEDIRYVKKHPELFSNNIYEYGSQRGGNVRNIAETWRAENGWKRVSTLQRTDPPVHTMYRSLINDAFSVARVRNMTDYVETCVNDLIDQFIDRGECDFIAEYAIPLPCTVIADQLGVPRDRIRDLKRWSDAHPVELLRAILNRHDLGAAKSLQARAQARRVVVAGECAGLNPQRRRANLRLDQRGNGADLGFRRQCRDLRRVREDDRRCAGRWRRHAAGSRRCSARRAGIAAHCRSAVR